MGIVSGGNGNTTAQVVASGEVVPVADATGVTINTTTYADPILGGGAKLTTLVFAADAGMISVAQAGDAFPRLLLASDPVNGGWYFGDGTIDPYNFGFSLAFTNTGVGIGGSLGVQAATTGNQAPRFRQLSPAFVTISGALSTFQLVSGTGTQVSTTGDVETITPVTMNPSAGAAATCKVELSPDNVTYSTVGIETEPVGIVFDGTIRLVKVRVPQTWYMKLTVTNAVLGLTTNY